MAKQGIKTHTVTRVIRINADAEDKPKAKASTVNVAPHVRMINGKPVMIAGYSYKK